MDSSDKRAMLARLSEDQLRDQVLVPLLGRLGFRAPTLYHGPREQGKDIICFDCDRLGQKVYLGVVAKTGDINGTVTSHRGVQEVCFQIQRCFDVPYEDLFGMRRVTMDQVWVVTNGRILASASESIGESLRKQNLAKLIRFVGVEQLVALIDEHFAAYWNHADESIESVRAQRDRALQLCGNILCSLGATKRDITTITNQLQNSQHLPDVGHVSDRRTFSVGPYAIELDKISQAYNNALLSSTGGCVRGQFAEIKRDLDGFAGEMEWCANLCQKALGIPDPREFVAFVEEQLAREDAFNGPSAYAENVRKGVRSLKEDLDDVDELIGRLKQRGKLEWAISLSDSVDRLLPEVERFVNGVDCDRFTIRWGIKDEGEGAVVKVVGDDKTGDCVRTFCTHHERQVKVRWHGGSMRDITASDIVDAVRLAIRELIELSSGAVKYAVGRYAEIHPCDRCPKCERTSESAFLRRGCPHCGAALGNDVKLLLDSGVCPYCSEGSVCQSNPTCDRCGETVDTDKVVWN